MFGVNYDSHKEFKNNRFFFIYAITTLYLKCYLSKEHKIVLE